MMYNNDILNPKDGNQAIYEIYRACRLCGAGGGYKMPIIQNVVELDGDEIELRQKIKECVQIEVNDTDLMPPLICELCMNKVNDFYQFLDMCKQYDRRTRQRLGLPLPPLHTPTRNSADTEPVFIDSDAELRNKNKSKKTKVTKETAEVMITTEPPRPSPVPVSAPVYRDNSSPRCSVVSVDNSSPRCSVVSLDNSSPRCSVVSLDNSSPSTRPEPRRDTRQSLEPVLTPGGRVVLGAPPRARTPEDHVLSVQSSPQFCDVLSDSSMNEDAVDPNEVNARFKALSRATSLQALKRRRVTAASATATSLHAPKRRRVTTATAATTTAGAGVGQGGKEGDQRDVSLSQPNEVNARSKPCRAAPRRPPRHCTRSSATAAAGAGAGAGVGRGRGARKRTRGTYPCCTLGRLGLDMKPSQLK